MPKRKGTDAGLEEVTAVEKKAKTKASAAPSAAQQKAQVSEVVQVTQADSKTAAKLLAKAGWNTSVAINSYFNSPSSLASNPTRKALDQIFDKYRSSPQESPNELQIDDTSQMLDDLGIPLDNCAALYFFEFTKSPQLGIIPRDGFVAGPFLEANCDTSGKIKKYVDSQLVTAQGTMEQYKAVYNHTFSLLIEDRKKAIDLEQAEIFWRMLTDETTGFAWVSKSSGVDFLDWWLEFLKGRGTKVINRDLWRQTLTFMLRMLEDESLGFWNEESSWPSVIDEFVGWIKVEKKGGEAMEE